jgi:hypothetical protein
MKICVSRFLLVPDFVRLPISERNKPWIEDCVIRLNAFVCQKPLTFSHHDRWVVPWVLSHFLTQGTYLVFPVVPATGLNATPASTTLLTTQVRS